MVKRILLALLLLGCFPFAAQSQTGVDKPRYEIVTYRGSTLLGSFEIELFPLIAPLHVQNFDSLVNENFFDSTAFHRVVPGFVIQGGDPNTINGPISTWGQGQPWQPTVPAEFSAVRHLRGILGAARDTNINSANSQFYVCVAPATFLDGNYTVYGKVTTGMSVVDTIVLSPRDVNDVPLQKISMFVNYIGVNDTVPDPVVLTDPANQAVNIGASQVFRWSTVPGAVLYTIEYATDSLFNNIVLTKKAGTNQTIANTLPGSTTYYWRVRANNGGHESVNSPVWSFTMLTGAVTLVNPPDSSTNVFLNPFFEWQPIAGADNYQLQVATAITFSSFSLAYSQNGITGSQQAVPSLNANTRYYWRVRSYNGSVAGFYSARYTFETGSTTGTGSTLVPSEPVIAIYPNPAKDHLQLEVNGNESAALVVLIRQLTGQVMVQEQFDAAAHHRVALPLNGLAAGVYIVELRHGTTFTAERFVVD